MRKQQIYDQEKVSFNLVKYSKFGNSFELVVDPDLVVSYKENKVEDVLEVLKAEKVFSDAKKGVLANEENILQAFKTDNLREIAKKMFSEGEIQFTSEYRENLRKEKKNRIVNIIHRTTINPKTNTPHPVIRIENAIAEAKVKIDEFKKAEDQIKDILQKLKPIIPIKKDEVSLKLKIPLNLASSIHGYLQSVGELKSQDWKADSFVCELIVPAGMKSEVLDSLNSKTRGEIDIKIN